SQICGYLDADSQKFTSIISGNLRYLLVIDAGGAQRPERLGVAHVVRIVAAKGDMGGAEAMDRVFQGHWAVGYRIEVKPFHVFTWRLGELQFRRVFTMVAP